MACIMHLKFTNLPPSKSLSVNTRLFLGVEEETQT